jgi:RHS repeat-associated protein
MPFGEALNAGVGNRTAETGLKYSMPGDLIRQKFTGYQKDSETSIDFAEARMYDNRYGRFTAVDPLLASGKSANPQTFNRFVYVLNNPLLLTDPSGLQVAQWYQPLSPNGELPYRFEITQPNDYEPVPKDSLGRLSGSGKGLGPNRAIIFNPDGPGVYPNRTEFLKDMIGGGLLFGNSWYRSGYTEGWSADYLENWIEPESGIRDASFEFYSIVLPVANGLRTAVALRSGLGSRLAASQFADDGVGLMASETSLLAPPTTIRHHVFNVFRGNSPKSDGYRQFFVDRQIDVHNYVVEIPEAMHKKFIHTAGNNWTTRWKQWIDANPNASAKEVYQFAGQLMDEYGLAGLPIVPYK